MSIGLEKNPQVKKVVEEQLKKKQSKAVLDKLIEKRSSEYKDYFSHSSEPSVIKRPRHISYDHIGQKRAIYLSKILRSFVVERIGSGEIGDILSGKNFQLTNIIVPVDLNRIEVLWWSPEQEAQTVEELLKKAGEELRTAIRHAQLLPNLPPVIFKRDNLQNEREQINQLLDSADKGLIEEKSIENTEEQRTDLYDSDRTAIIQKLSSNELDEHIQESSSIDGLSVEQMQRRMRAFALTKKMKRVQEQRNAIYGIMAIEKERDNEKHFSLAKSFEDDLDRK